MLLKIIVVAAVAAVAIAVAVVVFTMPAQSAPGVPNVKFTEFTPDRTDIKVGESTRIVFNVQNMEQRPINDSRVVTVIEPSSSEGFMSVNRPTIDLQDLQGRDARTGEMQVVITATGAPAKEALYVVKGILVVEGKQADIRQFDLRVRQQ